MNYNLACAAHLHSLTTPNAVAVASQGRSVTYGEMADRAARLAECLKQSRAWRRQDDGPPRVGILASRGIDACLALIGASWAGATYVPISPRFPEERIRTILSLCNLSAIIADKDGANLLSDKLLDECPPLVIVPYASALRAAQGSSKRELVDIESLPAISSSKPAVMEASDIAYIIFTSGTTGIPKGVMISAGSVRHYIRMVTDLLGLRASDRVLESCELTFDVSVHNIFATWRAGASVHVLPATRVMSAVEFARTAKLTVWNSVPSLVGMLRQAKALRPGILPNLRMTVFGGEQLPESVVAAWRAAAPNSVIYNFYGPTEATVFCLDQAVTSPTPLTPGRDFVAIGTPMPGTEAVILDGKGEVVADGMPGELAVGGSQLSMGYLNAPKLTAARFPTLRGKRWYMTGDLAMRDSSGTFHWLGRIDNQVKVLGHRIELEEVDAHLRIVANVDVVGAIAWPLVDGVARGIVAFVGLKSIDANQVIDDLKKRLPVHMIPSQILALETVPLNHNGKVDRRALRQLLEQASSETRSLSDMLAS
jgi:D-alanine--poly(phosphoribitol) ligase subunit 1